MSQDLVFSILPRAGVANIKKEMIKTPKMAKKSRSEHHADVKVQPKSKGRKAKDTSTGSDLVQHNIDLFV